MQDNSASSDLRYQLEHALGDAYRVTRMLSGGMAHVYVAELVATGEEVVVKVLEADLAAAVSIERFRREIQVAKSLVHPNIVPVGEAGHRDNLIWYSMPLIVGESLRGLLVREKQLSAERTIAIVRDVGAALTYAHSRNIVHRDVKPENILIDRDGRALVADFGIARAIEKSADVASVTSTGFIVGTPLYMSPEQAAGHSQLDGRSDLYSLACVTYEMLAGEPPFSGPTPQAVLARHLSESPRALRVIRPDVSSPLQLVIERGLAKAPAGRFATVESFVEALTNPSSVLAPPGGARWRWTVSGALATMAVGALVAVRAIGREPGPDPTRVAVLYFDAPSGDAELLAVARGVTRDVIASLPTNDLTVISASGIEQFRPNEAPAVVSTSLDGVGTIVYGGVEALGQGDSIRVSVRLVDARAVLLGTFKVETVRSAALGARDEVVQRVAEELRIRLGLSVALKQWRAGTSSTAAWRIRQQAQFVHDGAKQLVANGAAPLAMAAYLVEDSLLALATRSDPMWSEPGIARGWVQVSRALVAGGPAAAALIDSAITLAEREVARTPGAATAYELRGAARYRKWQFVLNREGTALRDSAEQDVRRATMLNASLARAWNVYSSLLQDRGDNAAALAAARRAIAADPYLRDIAPSFSRLTFSHLNAERYDSARALCAHAITRFAGDPVIRTCRLTVLGWSGKGSDDVARAWADVQAVERNPVSAAELAGEIAPVSRFLYAAVLARSRMDDSARRVITSTNAAARAAGRGDLYLLNEAHVWTVLGRADTATALLARVITTAPPMRERVAQHPWFKPLNADPAFRRLVAPQ